MRRAVKAAQVLLLLASAACGPLAPGARDQDWPLHGLDAGEQRFSTLEQVNAGAVGRLGVAWYADFEARSLRGVEGTPIVVDGAVYATGPRSKMVAVEAATGNRLQG
jgi:quinohemoprotein ethanol dehydrogenase